MRKIASIFLVFVLISAFVVSVNAAHFDTPPLSYGSTDERCISLDDAVKEYEEENSVKLETYRNYFYIPDGTESFFKDYEVKVPTWYNEYFTDVCIWYNYDMCENVPYPESYCGFSINKTSDKDIYYADIPIGVKRFLINNGVDAKSVGDTTQYKNCSTAGYLGPDSNKSQNETFTTCDNMIFVHNLFDCYSYSSTAYFFGEWYYYYGDGCYGEKNHGNRMVDCVREEHFDENGHHIADKNLLGDVDADGEVAVMDATIIQRVLAKMDPMFEDISVADVICDGEVTIIDATAIQMAVAKIEAE